jgi:hypothetical protein
MVHSEAFPAGIAFCFSFNPLKEHVCRQQEDRYTKMRQAVLDEVNRELAGSRHIGMRAKLIDQAALLQSGQWNQPARRRVDWQWVSGYNYSGSATPNDLKWRYGRAISSSA